MAKRHAASTGFRKVKIFRGFRGFRFRVFSEVGRWLKREFFPLP